MKELEIENKIRQEKKKTGTVYIYIAQTAAPSGLSLKANVFLCLEKHPKQMHNKKKGKTKKGKYTELKVRVENKKKDEKKQNKQKNRKKTQIKVKRYMLHTPCSSDGILQ